MESMNRRELLQRGSLALAATATPRLLHAQAHNTADTVQGRYRTLREVDVLINGQRTVNLEAWLPMLELTKR